MEEKKIQKLYDFRQVRVPEKLLEIPLEEHLLAEELSKVSVRFLTIEPAYDAVRPGDIVTIRPEAAPQDSSPGSGKDALQTPTPSPEKASSKELPPRREERPLLQINVQKNVFDAAWEQTLIGLEPGASLTLPPRAGGGMGCLMEIKRRVCPPVTDELIRRLNIEGVASVEDYRAYQANRLIQRKRRQKENVLLEYVMRETAKRSEFSDLSLEISQNLAAQKTDLERTAQREGLSYEKLLAMSVPKHLKTFSEQEAYLREAVLLNRKILLIGAFYAAEDGVNVSPQGWEQEKKAYLERGADPGEIEERFTYEAYEGQTLINCFSRRISNYYDDKFKVVRLV